MAVMSAQTLLDELALGAESIEAYPLDITGVEAEGDPYDWFAVTKMRYGKKRKDGTSVEDKTVIVYNDHITIAGIPPEAQDYRLGARSGLDWIIDRYRVKKDKASGIVNDPNDWSHETGQPRYVLDLITKITTVSVETQRIVNSLPELTVLDPEGDAR